MSLYPRTTLLSKSLLDEKEQAEAYQKGENILTYGLKK